MTYNIAIKTVRFGRCPISWGWLEAEKVDAAAYCCSVNLSHYPSPLSSESPFVELMLRPSPGRKPSPGSAAWIAGLMNTLFLDPGVSPWAAGPGGARDDSPRLQPWERDNQKRAALEGQYEQLRQMTPPLIPAGAG